MKYLKTFLYLLLFVQLVAAQTSPPNCPDLCTDCVYTNANGGNSEWRLGNFNTYEECALEAFKRDCNVANYNSDESSVLGECYCHYGSDRTEQNTWWQSCFLPSHQMKNEVLGNQLAVGNAHTCVILKHNNLARCWGKNDKGQLGRENTQTWGDAAEQMGDYLWKPFLGTGRTVVKIFSGVGAEHTCAILDNDDLKCWGAGDYAQTGLETVYNYGAHANTMGNNLPTVNLGTGKKAVSVAMGRKHTCALLNDGNVKCWGYQLNGRLGNDQSYDNNWGDHPTEMGDNLPNVNLGTGKTAIAIACTQGRTCALLNDGNVKCWGESYANGNDNLGGSGYAGKRNVGSGAGNTYGMGDSLPNINLGNDNGKVVSIACGLYHCCALTNEGRLLCWGKDDKAQLGTGSKTGGSGNFPQFARNDDGSCSGILDSFCMPPANVNLGTGKTAVSISAGSKSTCAVLNDGTAKCWGENTNGELGYGNTDIIGDHPNEMGDNLQAIDLGGVNVNKIGNGASFTCAVLANGYLKSWGSGLNGQLGSGDTITRGDEAGEMGNNLPYVNLGDAPWTVCNAGEEITTNGTSSVDRQCGACSNGRFATTLNQYSCTPWTDCVAGTRISNTGSATTDRQCTACEAAKFTSSANQQTCTAYSNVDDLTCTAGEMIQNATTTSDVQCVACPNGQFQTATNQYFCTPWTVCVAGEKVSKTETSTSDRQCEACPVGKFTGATNQQSCASWTNNIACSAGQKIQNGTSTSDTQCVVCPQGKFTSTTNQFSCSPWTNCYSGKKIKQNGTSSSDQQCEACTVGKFTSVKNQYSCTSWSDPDAVCVAGQYQCSYCGRSDTSDLVCKNCPAGQFTPGIDYAWCTSWTVCAAGQMVKEIGTSTSDRTCATCSNGSYTSTANQQNCSPWTVCAAGQKLKQNGNPSKTNDRQCEACPSGKFTSSVNELGCSSWSVCGNEEQETQKGTSTQNRKCAASASTSTGTNTGTNATDTVEVSIATNTLPLVRLLVVGIILTGYLL